MQFPKKVKKDFVMNVEITDNSKEVSGAIHQVGQAIADTGGFLQVRKVSAARSLHGTVAVRYSRKVPAGIAGFLQMGKSGAARAEFNAASAYTQRRKQRKASVAKRLQETRLKCGLKQQDVAERTGINVVTLSGYEIGKNEPNMEALVSLADVYGVTLDYLMCRTDS